MSGLNESRRAVEGFGTNMSTRLRDAGRGLVDLGGQMTLLTAPLTAFGVAGISVAADFEASMAEISARTGLVGDDLARISELSLQMGADTAFSAQQAADAFLQLLTSGSSVAESIAILPAVLDAAAASGMDLGATADGVTDIMAAFGLEAIGVTDEQRALAASLGVTDQVLEDFGNNVIETHPALRAFAEALGMTEYEAYKLLVHTEDAASVVDSLARAAGASSASMDDLFAGFANVGGVAAEFGLSVDQTAAILAIFAENGIKGAEAGTQLRSMLLNMSRDTAETQEAWNMLGTSLYDATGQIRPLEAVLRDITAASADMTDEERQRAFSQLAGSYGILGLTALTSGMSIGEMQDRMDDAAGAADVAAARMDTFEGRIDTLKGAIETLQIQALTPLMQNTLQPLVEQLTDTINQVTAWAEANPELASTLTQIGVVAAVAGPAIAALGFVLQGMGTVVGVITGGFKLLGGAIALLTSPIGIAIAAAGALVAAYMTNFGGVRDFIDGEVRPRLEAFFNFLGGVWESVKPALENLYNWFTTSALPEVQSFVETQALPALQTFFAFIGQIWEQVRPALESLYNWFVMTALPEIRNFVEGPVAQALTTLGDVLGGLWSVAELGLTMLEEWFMTSALPAIIQFVEQNVMPIIQSLRDLLAGLWEAVRPGLEAMFNWFRDTFTQIRDFIQEVIDKVNELAGGLGAWSGIGENADVVREGLESGQWTLGDVLNAAGGAIAAEFAPRASGGPVIAGQGYIVGDGGGPELFVPRSSGRIIPNDELRGGTSVNVYLTAYGQSPYELVDMIERTLRERGY